MILLSLLLACATESPRITVPPSARIVAPPAEDDFATILAMMKTNGCVSRGTSCVILHYGVLDDNVDYVFAGTPTSADVGGTDPDGNVEVSVGMQGQLWWVHPVRPLVANLDREGCTREFPCMAYVDADELNVWTFQTSDTFSISANN